MRSELLHSANTCSIATDAKEVIDCEHMLPLERRHVLRRESDLRERLRRCCFRRLPRRAETDVQSQLSAGERDVRCRVGHGYDHLTEWIDADAHRQSELQLIEDVDRAVALLSGNAPLRRQR